MARRYEAAGVDEMIFVLQAGRNRHEHICEALELFAAEVMPEFAARVDQQEREKAERLAPAIEAALARRDPPRRPPAGYAIDDVADLERARQARRARASLRDRAAAAVEELRERGRRGGQELLARFVRGASAEQLERRFGNQLAQRMLFTGMARQFDPKLAAGFEGDIVYELTHHADGGSARPPDRWTIRIRGERAEAIPTASHAPTVKFRFAIPDFVRLLSGEVVIQELMFEDRFDVAGDLNVAARLPVMFGEPGTL
jgi:hypothetical protein